MKRRGTQIRLTGEDRLVNALAIFIGLFTLVFTVYPVYYCFIYAFSDGTSALAHQIYFWPVDFTFDNFKSVLSDKLLVNSFFVSVARTALSVGTGWGSWAPALNAVNSRAIAAAARKINFFIYIN